MRSAGTSQSVAAPPGLAPLFQMTRRPRQFGFTLQPKPYPPIPGCCMAVRDSSPITGRDGCKAPK
jgi:hypothetical protein